MTRIKERRIIRIEGFCGKLSERIDTLEEKIEFNIKFDEKKIFQFDQKLKTLEKRVGEIIEMENNLLKNTTTLIAQSTSILDFYIETKNQIIGNFGSQLRTLQNLVYNIKKDMENNDN